MMQMRTEGPIRTRTEGAILEVTLDRPRANAIDLITSRLMGEVFRDFRYGRDNLLLSWMHTRLMVEFVLRLPLLMWRKRRGLPPFQP